MKSKRTLFFVSLLVLLGVAVAGISAEACDKCPLKSSSSKSCEGDKGKSKLETKFFKKCKFILYNKEDLQLTEKQEATIKALKHETKKTLIMKKAEVDTIKVDIYAKLWEDPIDLKAVNALIEKKYAAKEAKAKALVKAYTELKSALTDDQKAMMMTHWKSCSQCSGGVCPLKGSAGGDKMCPYTGKPLEAKGSMQ